jgi:hypothetical protein
VATQEAALLPGKWLLRDSLSWLVDESGEPG